MRNSTSFRIGRRWVLTVTVIDGSEGLVRVEQVNDDWAVGLVSKSGSGTWKIDWSDERWEIEGWEEVVEGGRGVFLMRGMGVPAEPGG